VPPTQLRKNVSRQLKDEDNDEQAEMNEELIKKISAFFVEAPAKDDEEDSVTESRVDTSGGPHDKFPSKRMRLNPDNPKAPPLNLAHIDGNPIHSLLRLAQRGRGLQSKNAQRILKQAGYEWENVPNINSRYASTRESVKKFDNALNEALSGKKMSWLTKNRIKDYFR